MNSLLFIILFFAIGFIFKTIDVVQQHVCAVERLGKYKRHEQPDRQRFGGDEVTIKDLTPALEPK